MAEAEFDLAYNTTMKIYGEWEEAAYGLYGVIRFVEFSNEFVELLPTLRLDIGFVNEVIEKLSGNDRWSTNWTDTDLANHCEVIKEAMDASSYTLTTANDFYSALLCGLIVTDERVNPDDLMMLCKAVDAAYGYRGVYELILAGASVESVYYGSLHDIDRELLGAL